MPSRAYIAHDRVVTAGRMYVQMALVGLLIAVAIYAGGMYAFCSHYIAKPVPEIVDGRLVITDESRKLPIRSLLKYYISANPQNYVNFHNTYSSRPASVPMETVEPELRVLLREERVPREIYQRAVHAVTQGRVDVLRRVVPVSLLFFPVFGVGYFFLFSWINKLTEKTEFVRGVDVIPFNEMKARLDSAIVKEKTKSPLRLGEVLLPKSVSRRHMLILGTSGTGKSVCLNRHIASLKGQGNKSIIYDVWLPMVMPV